MFIMFIFSSQKPYFDMDKDFFFVMGIFASDVHCWFSLICCFKCTGSLPNEFLTVIDIHVSVSTKNTSPPLRTADEGQGVDGCREGDGVGLQRRKSH